jgi:hypothetical protein
VDISGKIGNLRVNGVDVVPLVEAGLDHRYPDRPKMRPADSRGPEYAVVHDDRAGPDGL